MSGTTGAVDAATVAAAARSPSGPLDPDVAQLVDPALPSVGLLLDAVAMSPVLQRSFGAGPALDVRVRYLRYKPGTNLVVEYDVSADGLGRTATAMIAAGESLARRAAKPANVELAARVGGRSGAAEPLAFERDIGALVCWYPLDLSLPFLASPPGELRAKLRQQGLAATSDLSEPERLAYKPRRRAVLRIDGHVLKLYRRPDESQRAIAAQRAISDASPVPGPVHEAVLDGERTSVQSAMVGTPVTDAASIADAAGATLARLHGARVPGLRVFGSGDQLAAAAASARLVAAIQPGLTGRLERLLATLVVYQPVDAELVASHGDFNARQLLMTDAGVAVTDFDEASLAMRALDIATYAAYLVRGAPGDLMRASDALDRLLGAYGQRPASLDWYVSTMILRRAARPFRYLERDWPAKVAEMVGAAEEAFGR